MTERNGSQRVYFRETTLLVVLAILLIGCSASNPTTPANMPTLTPALNPTDSPTEDPIEPTATQQPSQAVPTDIPTVEMDKPISHVEQPIAERLPILEYHETSFTMSGDRVMMKEDWFLEQMEWLAEEGFHTLTAQELVDYIEGRYLPPKRSVVLTFDIGSAKADEYERIILPALREYNFEAIFFVLINAITDDGERNSISWDDLRNWNKEGVISVQSHGVYHPDYRMLSFNQMLWDAETSSKKIEEEIGERPILFAFPFDSVPERNLDLVMERVGYQLGLAGTRVERSVLAGDVDRYALPRYYPYSNEDAYPLLSDGRGWTFSEMMLAAIKGLDEEELYEEEPSGEKTPMTDAYQPSGLENLTSYCSRSIPDRLYGLDQYASFPTDLTICTRLALPADVIIKPTCNFGPAIIPEAVILHFTYGPYSSTVNEFRESALESSAHYIVDRDGTITQMVPEIFSSNHVTCYGDREMCTEECVICEDEDGRLHEPKFRSIGIELVNVGRLRGEPGDFRNPDGTAFTGLVYEDDQRSWGYRYWEDYPPEQIASLRLLLIDLMVRWNIPLNRVLGHHEVQKNKIDPGPALNLSHQRSGDPWRAALFGSDFTIPQMNCPEPAFPEGLPAPSR